MGYFSPEASLSEVSFLSFSTFDKEPIRTVSHRITWYILFLRRIWVVICFGDKSIRKSNLILPFSHPVGLDSIELYCLRREMYAAVGRCLHSHHGLVHIGTRWTTSGSCQGMWWLAGSNVPKSLCDMDLFFVRYSFLDLHCDLNILYIFLMTV